MLEALIPSAAGLAGIGILGYKKKEEVKKRSGEGAAAAVATSFLIGGLIYTLINIAIFCVIIYILYWNNAFVFKCKNGSVLHWLLANIFSIIYFIYRKFIHKPCKL